MPLEDYLLTPWCRVLLEKLTGLQLTGPRISRNPKVHYRTHKRPPPVSILDQPSPVHITTFHLLEIRPNIIHPSKPGSPQWSLSLRFPQQDPIQCQTIGLKCIRHGANHKKIKSHRMKCLFILFIYLLLSSGFLHCVVFCLFRRFGGMYWLLPCDWPASGGCWREWVKGNIPNPSYKSDMFYSP